MADRIVIVDRSSKVRIVAGGPKGDQGPGIESNIHRITASTDPPLNPEVNDLWIDLT